MTALFPDVPQHLTPGAVLVLTMRRRADISKAREELGYSPGRSSRSCARGTSSSCARG
jgi:nucleoside-diphosphate-sugar epimerase